jgi:uncharacterized protein YbjT (DUF2867 family)
VIVVAGGTGTLGRQLVPRLVGSGFPVRVLTRDAARAEVLSGVDVLVGDVRDRRQVDDSVRGADVVISSIHGFIGPGYVTPESVDRDGNAHLIDAAKREGAQFVLISAIGASPDHPWDLLRAKYAAEEQLRQSGIPYTIVRTYAFTETWGGIMLTSLRTSGKVLVFGRGDNPSNFVSVIDVAALVDMVVRDVNLRGRELDFGGPDTLTFNQLAAIVQEVAGHRVAIRHIPRPVLRVMGVLARPIKPQFARQARAAVVLDTVEMRFDPGPLRAEFPDLPATDVRHSLERLRDEATPP